MADLDAWLDGTGLGRHAGLMRSNDIDFDVLRTLTESDLKELGLSLGDRRRLLQAIAALDVATRATEAPAPAAPTPTADRRQLTVLFADLAGSTALAAALDPEELREVMRGYQAAVAGAIRDAGGFLAKYLGDGALAYFGYPQAQEDAAERAVRAGLAACAAVAALPAVRGAPLAARVGIATGPVVVGDVVGDDVAREVNVVGETPNLAARLQGLAAPGQVVIAETTRRLVGGLFALAELGLQELKGFAAPVSTYAVTAERAVESRFAAVRGGRARFVGRAQEVGLLLDRWESAKAGEGQLVLLSGEAGIGKSRITETFGLRISGEPHVRIRWQCSPQHVNSPLHPVAAQLARAAGIEPGDDDATKTAKLRAVLRASDADRLALIASVLGVPLPATSELAQMAAALRRQRTLAALVEELAIISRETPVLLLLDDAHWIDPTTQDLVGVIVDRLPQLGVLALITHRPEYKSPWTGATNVTQLALNRLTRAQIASLLNDLAGGRALPAAVVAHIVAKSDGIPLYVEEMFEALRDGGVLAESNDAFVLAHPLDGHAVPATLQDALMARLDRLAPAKAVAQIGAVIGREFDHRLLAEISGIAPAALQHGLDDLVAAGLVFARGAAPEASYVFKHALVQDAAYGSMLKTQRRDAHQRIAEALAKPDSGAEPEVVAQHFEAASISEKAAVAWAQAGMKAAAQSANQEAVGHYRKALRTIAELPNSADRLDQEVQLHLALGAALIATEGYGSAEVGAVYDRARELAKGIPDVAKRIAVVNGLRNWSLVRGDMRTSLALAKECLSLAEITNDDGLLLEGHNAVGVARFNIGEFVAANDHFSRALDLYDPVRHRSHLVTFARDPAVSAGSNRANTLLALGFPDQARRQLASSLELAKKTKHAQSMSIALSHAADFDFGMRNLEAATLSGDALRDFCEKFKMPMNLARAQAIAAWAASLLGHDPNAAERLRAAISDWRATGAEMYMPSFSAMLGEVLSREGRLPEALDVLHRSIDEIALNLHAVSKAELFRVLGGVERLQGNSTNAERHYVDAVTIAAAQRARFFELRAARDLAQLHLDHGRRDEARAVLAPVYAWFTEGFDTRDLKEAKALLAEIG